MTQTQQKQTADKSMWNFYKGRNTAVNVLGSLTKRHESHAEHWLPQIKLLQHLKDFPRSSIELRGIDSGAKSKLLKAHLNEVFPDCEFKVKLHRFVSMSTIVVKVMVGSSPDGIKDICDIYQDKGQQNPSTGSFDWDNKVEIQFPKSDGKPTYITGDDW